MTPLRLGILGAVLMAAGAAAQPLPPTEPAGVHVHPITLTLERAALPASITLLPPATVLGFNPDPQRGHGRLHLVCR